MSYVDRISLKFISTYTTCVLLQLRDACSIIIKDFGLYFFYEKIYSVGTVGISIDSYLASSWDSFCSKTSFFKRTIIAKNEMFFKFHLYLSKFILQL
jgi:hypothetical protein